MNKKNIGIVVCSALLIVFWFSFSNEKGTQHTIGSKDISPPEKLNTKSDQTAWTFQTVSTHPSEPTKKSSEDSLFTEAVKLQMAEISEAYEENMRYPNYSKPLFKNDWTALHPRAFVPKAMPLEGLSNTSAEIIIPRFIVTRDESIPVSVKIHSTGEDTPQAQEVTLTLGSNQKEIALKSSSSSGGTSNFNTLISSAELQNIQETDVILSANIIFENAKHAKVSTLFKLVGTEAILESLSDSYVEGSDLVIPANFSVDISGHYRVQANLFDKATLSPISHLNNTFKLDSGNSSGLLKVHAETLRSKGFAGPYVLKDFNVTRSPSAPGDLTGYGSSKEESFVIQGFDLDSYSREAYEDQQSQQRLQFLQKMAGLEQE